MLAWLQKGQERTQTGDGEDDTGGQTSVNFASEEQPASSNVSASAKTEGLLIHLLPVMSTITPQDKTGQTAGHRTHFCSQNEWLISKDKRLVSGLD